MTKGPGNRIIAYMSRRMIACDEASFLISYKEDHSLSFRKWWQLKMHLITCHLCRKYARQIGELNSSLELYRDQCSHDSCPHHLSPEAGSRISSVVDRGYNAK